jgi:hypothetical protein
MRRRQQAWRCKGGMSIASGSDVLTSWEGVTRGSVGVDGSWRGGGGSELWESGIGTGSRAAVADVGDS